MHSTTQTPDKNTHQALDHPWIKRLYAEGAASAEDMRGLLQSRLKAKKDMPAEEVRKRVCLPCVFRGGVVPCAVNSQSLSATPVTSSLLAYSVTDCRCINGLIFLVFFFARFHVFGSCESQRLKTFCPRLSAVLQMSTSGREYRMYHTCALLSAIAMRLVLAPGVFVLMVSERPLPIGA